MKKNNKLKRICSICSAEFYVFKSRLKVKNGGTCCSVKCGIESRSRSLSAASPLVTCDCCGKEFKVKLSRLKRGEVSCCSKYCTRELIRSNAEERFWSNVNKKGKVVSTELGNCHEWTARTVSGYGIFNIANSSVKAHRFAWKIKYGKYPSYLACHKCDNPACVNVEHIFIGTHQYNQADKIEKGRQSKGETHGIAKLTNSNVNEIRKLAASGITHRTIANTFNVKKSAITSIISGRTWSHLPDL